MLSFLYPTIVCVIMGTIFKEGFTKFQIAAIVVSVTGMFFLTGNGENMPVKGMVMAIASAFTYGTYLIANEKGPANTLPIEVKLFYVSLPATVLYTVIIPGKLEMPKSGAAGWAMVLASGVFTVGGYFLMMYGVSKLGAATASFVSMLEPIISVVFGTLWFHDPVTVGIVAGGGLVILSILFIAIDGYQKEKRQV